MGLDRDEDQVRLVVHHRGHELGGVVHRGESWAHAARRTCASLHAEPEPVDLGGAVKEFIVDPGTVVSVRTATQADLPHLVRWRLSKHVLRWWAWDGEPTREDIEAQYAPRIDGMSPIRMYVSEVNGRPVGWLQDYRLGDDPEYAGLGLDPDAVGVQYAIGEVEWTGRGVAPRVLWAWMHRARRRFPDASAYFAAPDHRNLAGRRVLARAGFTEGPQFDQPRSGDTVLTLVGSTLDVSAVIG